MAACHGGLKSIARSGSFPALPKWSPWLDLDYLETPAPIDTGVLLAPVAGMRAVPETVTGYSCRRVGQHYHYLDEQGDLAFRDTGSFIAIERATDPLAVAAALQLAAERWKGHSLVVVGDRAFMLMCAQLAVHLEIDIETEFVRKEMKRLHGAKAKNVEAKLRPVEEPVAALPASEPVVLTITSPEPGRDAEAGRLSSETTAFMETPDRSENWGKRSLLWDPTAEYAQGSPSVAEWVDANRAKASPDVLGRLASAVLADPKAREAHAEMSAQGVREARLIAEQAARHARLQRG